MAEMVDNEDAQASAPGLDEQLTHSEQESGEQEFLDFEKEIFGALEKAIKVPFLRVVSSECAQIQHDEFVALKAIFEDDLAMVDDDARCFKITVTDMTSGYTEDEIIDLWFSIPADYPNIPPIFELEGHGALSYQKADELYSCLLELATSRVPDTMLYDLIMLAKEFLSEHVMSRRESIQDQNQEIAQGEEEEAAASDDDMDYIKVGNTFSYRGNQRLHPTAYTGPLHKVIERVPQHLQVASIENILRADLAERFEREEKYLNKKYFEQSRKSPKAYELRPVLGFHGTAQGNIPNIVRRGLVVPGMDNEVGVAHGSSLGLGIYLSPDPSYSFGYCDSGGTVLVCSVLLGHVLKGYARASGKYDSCITSDDLEMVIFHPAQVLPCYLVRLVRRNEKLKGDHLEPTMGPMIPSALKAAKKDESAQEKQKRLAARAKKFLPYGFGPESARGPKMVIEDVADSDDDEEDYGAYQTLRYEVEKYEDY